MKTMFHYTSNMETDILEEFDFDEEDVNQVIIPPIPEPSKFYCSTLAIQAKFNCTFDCNFLYNNIVLTKGLIHAVRLRDHPVRYLSEYYTPPISKKQKGFPYQVSVVIPHQDFFKKTSRKERRVIDIMLFNKGRVVMRGLKKIEDIDYVIKIVRKMLITTKDDNGKYGFEGTLEVDNIQINLMNCHYDINFKLNRRIFFNILKEYKSEKIQNVDFDPDNYQGIKLYVKVSQGATLSCLIFDQKINLTGGKGLKTMEERREAIQEVYDFINSIIRENYQKIFKSIE